MSDTHAHTATAQADVQTGKPHYPPGHVEADRPVEQIGTQRTGAGGRAFAAGAIGLVVLLVIVALLA